MDFSFKRVNAIFMKEFKDFSKNPNVLIMCFLPIMFALIYGKLMGNAVPKIAALCICTLCSLTMVGCLVVAILIAEEKEKNTLKTLMLSPLSPIEFLLGKSLITLFLCLITNLIIFFLVNPSGINLIIYIIISLISSVTMIILGAVIGLLSKTQMETSIIGFPIYMGLMLIPMLSNINSLFKSIANLFFTYHTIEILGKVYKGQNLFSIRYDLLVIFIWLIISLLLFIFTCKKVKLDK